MLGVIGAEFGHEIEPSRRKLEDIKKGKKSAQEGFTLKNYSLARHTSKSSFIQFIWDYMTGTHCVQYSCYLSTTCIEHYDACKQIVSCLIM